MNNLEKLANVDQTIDWAVREITYLRDLLKVMLYMRIYRNSMK